jgi:hypothetical protein
MSRPFGSCPASESGTILWYIRIGTRYSRYGTGVGRLVGVGFGVGLGVGVGASGVMVGVGVAALSTIVGVAAWAGRDALASPTSREAVVVGDAAPPVKLAGMQAATAAAYIEIIRAAPRDTLTLVDRTGNDTRLPSNC